MISAPFLGRDQELGTLGRHLDESSAGRGGLVAVSGDAGIGKTRLIAETARLAGERGFNVFWSQMIEDPVAPPFFPWLLALRSGLQQLDDEVLQADLGSGARDVAALLPELADRLAIEPARAVSDANAARFQLFDSITRFLLALARRRPLILLFDNLHLADRSTLQLLEYCCKQIATSPILILVAYRTSEVEASHPLHASLLRFAGIAGYETVELRGLARDEVARLLHLQLGHPATPALVDALVERSDGNPLYVCEVAQELRRHAAPESASAIALDFKLPAGLREVIAGRLASLEPATVDLLRTAAVLGRDFDAGLLATVAEENLDQVGPALDTARAAGVLVALEARRLRFQHALFREVLYAQHGQAQRIALHRAAAVGLERSGASRDPTSIAQLAYHYFESARAGYDARAVGYCREAAREALARRAYGEAVVQLERALHVVERAADLDSVTRFEVLSALGDAQYRAGLVNQAAQTLLKAALLAHRQKWWDRLPDAVIGLQNMLGQTGIGHLAAVPLHQVALEHLPDEAVATRVRLLASMSLAYRYQPDSERAIATLHESVRLARPLGDAAVLMTSLQRATWVLWESPHAALQEAMLREALTLAERLGDENEILRTLMGCVFPLLKLGRLDELRPLLSRFREMADQARDPHYRNVTAGVTTALAILEGRWADATRSAMVSLRQAALQGTVGLEGRFGFQMFAIQRARGQLATIAPLLKQITESSEHRLWLPGQILLHYELGQFEAARAALGRLGPLAELPRDDLYEASLVYLAEACSGLKDLARCRDLATLLQACRSSNVCLPGTLAFGSGARYLALLAVAMRRHAEARELFEEAIEFNARIGAAPLLAQTRVEYAALLLKDERLTDQNRARELLARARTAAQELDMRSLLVRIDELAAARSAAPDLTDRELAVLRLIAAGESNKQIAKELFVSHSTVATHIRNILRKTATRNRTEAVAYARRCQLIPDG